MDDAASRLMGLRFVPAETTQAYMEALGAYLSRYGRLAAVYSDRHRIFRVLKMRFRLVHIYLHHGDLT